MAACMTMALLACPGSCPGFGPHAPKHPVMLTWLIPTSSLSPPSSSSLHAVVFSVHGGSDEEGFDYDDCMVRGRRRGGAPCMPLHACCSWLVEDVGHE